MNSLRSFWPQTGHPGAILSNARIGHYIRRGYYGASRQQKLLNGDRIVAERRAKRASAPQVSTRPSADLLNLF